MRSPEDPREACARSLSPEAIASRLRTTYLGRVIIYTPVTGSTNDDARRLAIETDGDMLKYPSGTLVLAETQTSGKGRLGRQWLSPAGGIFMSLILRPNVPPENIPLLSLVAGFSVASAIRRLTRLDARVKWPNDVLVGGKKVCGILSELSAAPVRFVVCGIGINANQQVSDLPALIRDIASSVRVLTGQPVDRDTLIANILNEMESALDRFVRDGLVGLHGKLTQIAAYVGEPVELSNRSACDRASVTGVFVGIDEGGRALIRIPGEGVKPFSAGDLSLRPKQSQRTD